MHYLIQNFVFRAHASLRSESVGGGGALSVARITIASLERVFRKRKTKTNVSSLGVTPQPLCLPSVHAALVSVVLKTCATMTFDPKKVFIGRIHAELNKPHVEEWLENRGVVGNNVFMLPTKTVPGKNVNVQCCFVTFDTEEEAEACINYLHDDTDPAITPTAIVASIIVTQHGSLFNF